MPWMSIAASVGGSLVSGLMGKKSADKASQAQQQADAQAAAVQREQIAENKRQFEATRTDLQPFREAGSASVMRLRELMGLGSAGPRAPAGPYTTADAGAGEFNYDEAYQKAYDKALKTSSDIHQRDYGMPLAQAAGSSTYAAEMANIEEFARARAHDAQMAFEAERAAAANAAPPPAADSYQIYGDSPLLRRFTVNDFWADPVTKLGFQFGMDRGTRGIEQTAASRGLRHSGNTLKALTQFGTDYAGTKAGESQQRFVGEQSNVYNRLAGLAGTGQAATTTTGQFGANMAGTNSGITGNIANMISSGGNARGAAAIAGGNALGGIGTNISNWWNQKNMMDRIFPQGVGGGTTTIPGVFNGSSSVFDGL